MKKFLLLSALALGAMTASAQSFTDYMDVTYEGKTVENGGFIMSSETDPDGSMYVCDYLFTPKIDPSKISFHYTGYYTDCPSYETWLTGEGFNKMPWGTPSICYEMGGMGNCLPGHDNIISDYGFDKLTAPLEIQFHLMGDMVFNGESLDFILPSKTGIYRVVHTIEVDGVPVEDDFVVDIIIGPDPAGVDGIVDDSNAPVEYFDLMGRKLNNPEKGQIVIVRQGSKAKKVLF